MKLNASSDKWANGSVQSWTAVQKLLDTIEGISTPAIICDPLLMIVHSNRAFYYLSGFISSSITGTSMKDIRISLLSGESIWDGFFGNKETEGVSEIHFPAKSVICSVNTIPIKNDNGSLDQLVILFHDHAKYTLLHDIINYELICSSLSHNMEILAELDGKVLWMSHEAEIEYRRNKSDTSVSIWDLGPLRLLPESERSLLLKEKKVHTFSLKIGESETRLLFRRQNIPVLKRELLYISVASNQVSSEEKFIQLYDHDTLVRRVSDNPITENSVLPQKKFLHSLKKLLLSMNLEGLKRSLFL